MESKRVIKLRKVFWTNIAWGFGTYILILFIMFNTLSMAMRVFALLGGIVMFVYGYVCGYSAGKEHVNSVLDFMDSKLRWEVLQAEDKMYDKEDEDYYNQKQE